MRFVRRVFLIFILFCLSIVGGIEVLAMNTGFSTEKLSEKDEDTFLSNTSITLLMEEPQKQPIDCFDVNHTGLIAIVCSSFEKKLICVYDEKTFLYGFALNSNGAVGIEWNNNDINIYFVRSDIIATVNAKAEIIEVSRVQNTSKNNAYLNQIVYSTSRPIGDTRYSISNNMGILNLAASSYSQLIVTNSTGEEVILYDVSSTQLAKAVTICILVVIFFLLTIVVIIYGSKGRFAVPSRGDEIHPN